MKGLNELAAKFAYFAGHEDYIGGEGSAADPSDSSTYYYPGMSIDWQDFHPNDPNSLDHKRDGEDLEEEDWDKEDDNEDEDDDKIKEIKRNKKQVVLTPSKPYSRMYSSFTGLEGGYASPTEYYSGSVLNSPDGSEMYNPWNGIYQSMTEASTKQERMEIRGKLLAAIRKCQ
jgi:hypothetical protein